MSYETGARPAVTARRGPGPLGLLGRACYRHRWITLIVWLAGVACLVTLWTRFGAPAQDNPGNSDPGQSKLPRRVRPGQRDHGLREDEPLAGEAALTRTAG